MGCIAYGLGHCLPWALLVRRNKARGATDCGASMAAEYQGLCSFYATQSHTPHLTPPRLRAEMHARLRTLAPGCPTPARTSTTSTFCVLSRHRPGYVMARALGSPQGVQCRSIGGGTTQDRSKRSHAREWEPVAGDAVRRDSTIIGITLSLVECIGLPIRRTCSG